ncbi:DmX-like protein 1, partial [Acipenser ruthenus]
SGTHLLTGSNSLQLWSNVGLGSCIKEEEKQEMTINNGLGDWKCIWLSKTASSVHLMKFSPDGDFFATAGKLNLKQFRRGRRSPAIAAHTGYLPHQQDTHEAHRNNSSLHANALCHFHIAASINPATDIPLLPSITSMSLDDDDDEDQNGPFVVHWLNNKELHFTLSMEVFLQQLRKSLDQQSPETSTEETHQPDEAIYNKDEQKGSSGKSDYSNAGALPLPAAAIDHEIEILLAEWNKNADMMFSIHPMDGSLLVWHVDWLDEYQPGMFRQVQVSFVSRIPVAFPTGDANSLSRSIVMYACTKNVDLAIQQGKQKPPGMIRSSSMLISFGNNKSSSSLKLSIFTPNVLMISKHADGSLNQWAVSFAEESAFSTVLSVSHKSRYCGHRFHLNDLACHSVLPLLLTTSHHNALRTPEVDSMNDNKGLDNTMPRDPLSKRLSRVSVDATFQDPHAIYSELILWRVDPVGPLSFSGGVSELARINSLHVSAFSNVAWLPTLIPSNCLGAYSNSPSACFVASDGHSLRLYQAVIEAKKLLSELSNPDISKYVGEVFNIVSQQSTARPGCIIELDAITDLHGRETQLLHVYEEDFILGKKMKGDGIQETEESTPSETGHLSSCSIHPTGLAPYLLATSCSDGKVRFWRCRVDPESLFSKAEDSGQCSYTYIWEEWPLLIEDGFLSSSTVTVMGRPIEVSCCNTSRIAVAYKQTSSQYCGKDFTMHVGIFECESTGGSQWILEQTLSLDEPSTMLDPRISIDSNLTVYNKQDVYLSSDIHVMPSAKHLINLDWVSREDGSHILTVGIGSKLLMYGQLSGKMPEKGSKEGPAASALPLWEGAKDHSYSRFVLLRSVDLVASFEGSLALPVSLSWVRDGILVVGMDCEMHVYSQWQPPAKSELTTTEIDCGSTTSLITSIRQGHANGVNQKPAKKTLTRSMTSLAQKLSGKKTMYDLPDEMEDNGLFEAAHDLFPTLPQYHPVQLMELMDLGKVRRAKAILSHLVKCIAGEVVALKDDSTNHERRLRSLSISASGSTARDPKTFSKTENSDYTEIDSIPPLPLYALLAADEDTSHKAIDKSTNSILSKKNREEGDDYDELFQTPSLGTDDFGLLDTDEEDTDAKVIDLSQYSPTYFGPEHAQVLSSHLLHSSLPGLTRMEQMSLMALADTIATTSTDVGESRYKSLSTCHFSWAFHSEAEEELLNMLPAMQKGNPTWSELRAMGIGWWVAKAAFQRNNDPLDAAIYYLAMKKKAVVWGLYRAQRDSKMTPFFNNNFSEDRWRKAALKNAFALLGKQRFEHSAAFFLLAGSLKDAVEVCLEKMNDIQLALVISRLYESEFEVSSTYKNILQKRILGYDSHERTFTLSQMHQDPFFRSMAYWILEDYSKALDTLLEQPVREEDDAGPTGVGAMSSSCNPMVFNFYNYLRTHPLLLRRHFASSEKPSTKMGLTVENSFADTINLVERRLFFTAAHAHFKAGCPMLALEVLSKMPKVVKKSKPLLSKESSTHSESTKDSLLSAEIKQEKDSDCDWSQTVVNGFGSVSHCLTNGQSESVLSLDWSQSSLIIQDEALDLNWDSDKEQETDDEESGLSMKDIKTENNNIIMKGELDNSSAYTDSSTVGEVDVITPSEDTIAAQLKFSACLKILTTELRTLSTGYEVDGGKLRYQLYHWLEREVVALQKACDYNPDLEDLEEGIAGNADETDTEQSAEDLVHQQRAVQQKEYLQKRRLWLLKNQPLFRMFLSYCSLHGSHGGGLGSVRMELILLLQESQQIYVMHTLAASLSACIYQCLCNSQSYSASHANQFTGIIYQSFLLTHQHPMRTMSLDETVTPNTSPAQWPGIVALIRLLNSSGEEDQPGLTVLLCEILTAVFLSLFVHGLATHSSNELFRIVAHPLNSKMWAAVFGGGARIPVKEQSPKKPATVTTVSDESEKHHKRFKLLSTKGASRESLQSPTSPVVNQEMPVFREKFIPPELSIWDFFIAKPFLPPSESRVEYDSEESQGSDDEDDDEEEDVYVSETQLQEHSNPNSYRSKQRSALPVKRLWQYLVKQDEVQETFIRNIFTKKRGQNELIEDHNENAKNTVMEELNINKIEADLGYPGGKARIIHKESDIITAFAINKANRNCIAIASTHDIQELDVSAILATQILTWVDDEVELENKGSEDFLMIHARDDFSCIQDLTGAQDGSVRMFEWGHSQQIICFRPPGNSRVTRIRFNYQGNKFGIVDADGCLSFWQTSTIGNTPKPYLTLQCHNKTANDFVFVGSSSLIATAGQSSDNRNVCLWDTLVTPANSLVHAFTCHDSGATVLTYAPKHQLLISGGRKGFICVFDLHQRQQRQIFQAHDSPVKAVAVDPTEEYFITGSAEGSMKVWSLSTHSLIHTFINEHARQSIFRNIGTGVMQIEAGLANHIFSCGADGTMKMRILPDRFSTMNGVWKNDVKCII